MTRVASNAQAVRQPLAEPFLLLIFSAVVSFCCLLFNTSKCTPCACERCYEPDTNRFLPVVWDCAGQEVPFLWLSV